MELETVLEEDEGCSSEKSIEARLSISNPKRSCQNGDKRICEEASRVACCIHSVTLKQTYVAAHNQADVSQDGDCGHRKTSPPSTSRCCGREIDHFRSSDDENMAPDSRSLTAKNYQVCVMSCTDVVHSDDADASSPHGSFRSDGSGGDRALEAVAATPGTFGEIKVNNSSDVHFGNKIYTAPITVVNQVGGDDPDLVIDSGSFKGPSKKSSSASYKTVLMHVTNSARSKISASTGRNILTAFYFLVIVGLSIGLIIALISSSKTVETSTMTPPSIPNEQDIYFNETWFYTRHDWKAASPTVVINFQHPLEFVVISHTHILSLVCTGSVFCSMYIRLMQKIQMEYQLHDISYNYLISSGKDGALYVGRGANVEGEHTPGFNAKSLGIAFIGDYNKRTPNENQIAHVKLLIAEAVRLGKLSDRYKLIGQGQLIDTDSPGKNLMEVIQDWDHWVEHPIKHIRSSNSNDYATSHDYV